MSAKFASAVAAVVSALAGCTSAPTTALPHEYVDEVTGASVTIPKDALWFVAQDRQLSLQGAAVDRSGDTQCYLIGYFWSKVEPTATLALVYDTGEMTLDPLPAIPKDLTSGKFFLDSQRSLFPRAAYALSLTQLSTLAHSHELTLRVTAPGVPPELLVLSGDGKVALSGFVERLQPQHP